MNYSFKGLRAARRADAEAAVSLAKRRAWYGQTPVVDQDWETVFEDLTPAMRARFFAGINRTPPTENIFDLYNIQTSMKGSEKLLADDGLSIGDIPEYNGAIEYDSPDLEEPFTLYHTEYAKGFAVKRSLVDDADFNIVGQLATNLGVAFQRKRLTMAADVFNKAFSATYLGPDGKALIATDHPVGSGTVSNKGTADLSTSAVISARTDMMAWEDVNGNPLMVSPDTLVVPSTLEASAWVIVNSLNAPGTANNDGNFVRSLNWDVKVSRFISDPDAWFLADSQLAKFYNYWFNRVLPEFALDPRSNFDLEARYRGYMRFARGFSGWQWIWGSDGSAS
jgi:hypothetical protein